MPRPPAPWIRRAALTAAAAALLLPGATAAPLDFSRDIQPLLAAHCLKCHGPEKQKGGLRLDHRAAAFSGGDDGPVIAPAQSHASPLFQRISSLDPDEIMPPQGDPLSPTQIALLRDWIDQGAPWPDDAPPLPAPTGPSNPSRPPPSPPAPFPPSTPLSRPASTKTASTSPPRPIAPPSFAASLSIC